MTEKMAYSVAEAAELLGVSKPVLYKQIHGGGFPAVRISENRYIIPKSGLEEWLKSRQGITA